MSLSCYYSMPKFDPNPMHKLILLLCLILEFEIIAEKDENEKEPEFNTTTTEKNIEAGETFTKCYDELGCVNTNDKWYDKQNRPINLKPLNREVIKTSFILIRRNRTTIHSNDIFYQIMTMTENSIITTGYKKDTFLFILIHDFTSNGKTGWIKHISKVLKSRTKKCNIISVDWHEGAQPPFDQAIANARVVALEIIHMITFLKNENELTKDKIHIIGHGVGAHIAGYVGNAFNGTINKITGLDPTGLRFEKMPKIVRLDPTDAKYVEVLHTDAVEENFQGSKELFGHTDFFINNADFQPGCPKDQQRYDLLSVTRDILTQGEVLPGCSHKRAYKYFIESLEVEECTFLGIKCPSFLEFKQGKCTTCGENCRTFGLVTYTAPNIGLYFLQTESRMPYCLYQYKVKIQIRNDKSSYFGSFDFILIDKNHYSTTSSMLEPREFKPGSESFVFYAGVPKMSRLVTAKVGWKEKPNTFCVINCKQAINVEKVSIKSINSNTKNSQATQLCPVDHLTEIQNGDYQDFVSCKK